MGTFCYNDCHETENVTVTAEIIKCFEAVVSWVAIITYSNTLLQLNNDNK